MAVAALDSVGGNKLKKTLAGFYLSAVVSSGQDKTICKSNNDTVSSSFMEQDIENLLSLQLLHLVKPVSFRNRMDVSHGCSCVTLYEEL